MHNTHPPPPYHPDEKQPSLLPRRKQFLRNRTKFDVAYMNLNLMSGDNNCVCRSNGGGAGPEL